MIGLIPRIKGMTMSNNDHKITTLLEQRERVPGYIHVWYIDLRSKQSAPECLDLSTLLDFKWWLISAWGQFPQQLWVHITLIKPSFVGCDVASILKYAADTGHNILCDVHDIEARNKKGCFDEAARAYNFGKSTGFRDGYSKGQREGYNEAVFSVGLLTSKW